MRHTLKRALCLALIACLLPASALCGCAGGGIPDDTTSGGADTAGTDAAPVTAPDTTAPTDASSDTAAATEAATEPSADHTCAPDAFGICTLCGRGSPVTLTKTIPAADLPCDALYAPLCGKYGLSLTVTLSLDGNGGYTLVKSYTAPADAKAAHADFTFTGTCAASPDGLVLSVPDDARADVDLSAYAHISYTADASSDPSLTGLFPTACPCAGIAARSQTLTADEDGTPVFVLDDCSHPSHTPDRVCTVCGRTVQHTRDAEKDCCAVCGTEIGYAVKKVPSPYLNKSKCPEKGRVEKMVYESFNYSTKQTYENTLFVYLPYGYDENPDATYNVLYLLHGSGENAAYWLAQLSYKNGYTESTKVLLDNLHYYKLCEPTIVVTPTENLNGTGNFYREVTDYIIPLVETRYRTKANVCGLDPSEMTAGDMAVSRDSRAFAGLSLGSIITWDVMNRHLDKFAYYGFYSGGTCGNDRKIMLRRTLKNGDNRVYPIRFAYHSCGTADTMYADHIADYKYFLKETDMWQDGVNTVFVDKPGFKHNYDSWIIDLYNSLAVDFFRH